MKKYVPLTLGSLEHSYTYITKFKFSVVLVSLFVLFGIQNIIAQDSFETNFDGWDNVIGDQSNWSRGSGATPSPNTGPSSGSVGNSYLYYEATGGTPGDRAWVQKEFTIPANVNAKLSFDFHMFGVTMGIFNVFISTNNGATFSQIFTANGDKGDIWNVQSTVLSDFVNQTIIVRFESIRGTDFASDIAIDNISITTQPLIDTDNDGVEDVNDLDDDNDGILDYVECPNVNFSKDLIIGNARSGNITVVEGGASGTPFVTNAGPNDNESGLRYIDLAANPSYYRLNTKGNDLSYIDGNNLTFRLFVDDPGEDFFGGTTDIRLGSGATQLTLDLTEAPFGQTKPTGSDFTISVALTADNFGVTQAQFNTVISALDYIDIRAEFWLGPTGTVESELIPILNDDCDFDNDGIPNHLDTDSDGDGCSDADEAYFGSVANADSDNNGTYGSGTPAVDTTGKVTTAPYTTPNNFYLNTTVNTCNDNDNDGVPDGVDLDDDNDGILDTIESNGLNPTADADNDGVPNYQDADFCTLANGVCANLDSDGDGIPNHLDLDSDNDGCTDANEAYFGSVNRVDNDEDGLYGTGTPSVNGQGNVSGASYNTPNPYYLNASVAACNDTDNDGVPNSVDLDDDNDGILDTNEDFNCSAGFIDLGKVFSNATLSPFNVNNIYAFDGVDVNASFELVGTSTWNSGVESKTTAGITGSYINTQPNNTSFPDGNVVVYTYTFSKPVYNIEFKFGGLDVQDRADFTASNNGENRFVALSDINLGSNAKFGNQTVISSAGGSNAPNNAIQVSVLGATTQISIRVGKQNGNLGNVTMQFYDLKYCTANDFDNDGIPNHLDTDSDGDGCSDADEAYFGSVANADSDNNGTYGSGTPAVDTTGKVTTAPYTTPNNFYLNTTVNTCNDNDNDGVPDGVDLDDDNDGILDANEYNNDCGTAPSTNIHFTDASYNQISANSNDGDLVAYIKDFDSNVTAISTTTIGSGSFPAGTPNYQDGSVQVDMQSRNSGSEITGTTTEIVFSELILSSNFNVRSLARNASGTYNESQNIKFYNNGVQVQFPAVIYAISGTVGAGASYDSVSGDAIAAIIGGGAQEANFSFDINQPIDKIVISQLAEANADNIGWRISILCPFYLDTDDDGIPNHLDTDSDGDGCSDADEAYFGSVANADSDNNGTYGSGTPAVDTTGKVTTAPYTTPNNFYLNTTVNTCNDNDNDGVPDAVDLDDDNDGILDTDECIFTDKQATRVGSGNINNPQTYQFVATPATTVTISTDTGVFLSGAFSRFGFNETTSGNGTYTISFGEGVSNINLLSDSVGTEMVGNLNTATAGIDFAGQALFGNFSATLANGTVMSNLAVSISVNPVGQAELVGQTVINGKTYITDKTANGNQASGTISFPSLIGKNVTSLTFDSIGDGVGPVLWLGIKASKCPDTDADGIPNKLDTDSDNDGCPDAIEGAGTFTPAQVTSSLTGGSAGGSLLNFGTTVNTKGIPTTVTGGAVTGTETTGQATTAAVLDANDKTACAADLSIIKTVDKAVPKKGATVIFTLTLKNDGPVDATGVKVKDLLPVGLTYNAGASTIPINTTYTAATGIWDLSAITISKNQTIEIKIAGTVTTAGAIITNKTEIFFSNQTDTDSTPNSNN